MRWVSMYSESWTMDLGSTMEARDFVERFPLNANRVISYMEGLKESQDNLHARLFPLESSQVVLDLVILRILEPDVIVDASSFLWRRILALVLEKYC